MRWGTHRAQAFGDPMKDELYSHTKRGRNSAGSNYKHLLIDGYLQRCEVGVRFMILLVQTFRTDRGSRGQPALKLTAGRTRIRIALSSYTMLQLS